MDAVHAKKEWFRSWFDSVYYPMLYNNRDQQEANAFLELLVHKLDLPIGASILDLACGKGRHSLALNSLGFHVTGIDLAPNSIKAANEHQNEHLHFEVADMRTFDLNQKFDAIFNLFTSFGYFDLVSDNQLVLDRVKAHLHPGSWFVIDYFNATKVVNELMPQGHKQVGEVKFYWEKYVADGFVHKKIEVHHQEHTHHFAEKVQLFRKDEFVEMLSQKGFEVNMVFGSYNLDDFSELNSDRVILVCKA
jgi:2-polyprenyl-3-methyl-5-hydroxy-6-metoxy-1,4-benzoquinol methylase